ncbi:MAG: hypothetical protein EPN38_08560 [Rhodanobacteraceae bacterium]|nr:MAG: hypothetical protein EPN38_08560 [Rhodanobacteraceae bacterium]
MITITLSRTLRGNLRALVRAGYRGTVLALDREAHLVAVLDVQAERERYLAIIRADAMPAEASGLLTLPGLQFGEGRPDPERALRAAIDAARDAGMEIDLAAAMVTLQ